LWEEGKLPYMQDLGWKRIPAKMSNEKNTGLFGSYKGVILPDYRDNNKP